MEKKSMVYVVDDKLTVSDFLRGAIEVKLDIKTLPYSLTDIFYLNDMELFHGQEKPDVILIFDESIQNLQAIEADREKAFELLVQAWRDKFPSTAIVVGSGDSCINYFGLSEIPGIERIDADLTANADAFNRLCAAIKKEIG